VQIIIIQKKFKGPNGVRLLDWIRKAGKKKAKSLPELNKRVGFVEEKPNVWRVVYVDEVAQQGNTPKSQKI
jgi:hypothetical protein